MSKRPVKIGELRDLAKADYEQVLGAIEIVEGLLNRIKAEERTEVEPQPAIEPKPEPETKRCSKCEVHKAPEDFPRNIHARDGRANICRECAATSERVNAERRRRERAAEASEVHEAGRKTCSRCKHEKPVEDFSPDKRTNDGFTLLCNDCIERERTVRKGGSARGLATSRAAAPPAEKACTICGETKPLAEFPANSVSNDGRRSDCKKCHNAARKRSPDTNGDARYCAKGSNCLAYEVGGMPAILDAANSSPLCRRCQKRAGVA